MKEAQINIDGTIFLTSLLKIQAFYLTKNNIFLETTISSFH